MKPIKAEKMHYIRLGEDEEFVDESIKKGLLKLGFKNVDHELCINGKWAEVHDFYIALNHTESVATRYVNQLKKFYTSDDETMWVTVIDNRIWWCFAKPEITVNRNNTKTRTVTDKWCGTDRQGRILDNNLIDDLVLKDITFRGTIRDVSDKNRDYILSVINCE